MARTVAILLVAISLVSVPRPAPGAQQVLPDARPAFGILAAGAKVVSTSPFRANLTLQNGLKLWFAVKPSPSARVVPTQGLSTAAISSRFFVLAPKSEVTFLASFTEPGDQVTLIGSLNSLDAALLNIEQALVDGLLAMIPSGVSLDPKSIMEALQDFKAILAMRQAAMAFIPPPRTAKGWAEATTRAARSLGSLLTDDQQAALFRQALSKVVGISLSQENLKQLLSPLRLTRLLNTVADEAVFVYVTKGREPKVIFERTQPATGTIHTPPEGSAERNAIIDALRAVVERELGQKVIFRIQRAPKATPAECQRYPQTCKFHDGREIFRVKGDWVFVKFTMTQSNGKPIDYSKTKYRQQYEWGVLDDVSPALLQKRNGRWVVVALVIGPTDVTELEWCRKYGAPGSIFPYDYGRGCPG